MHRLWGGWQDVTQDQRQGYNQQSQFDVKQELSIGQELRLKQGTILAPQLQQGVRVLQLSSAELYDEIEQALQSNPFLEKLEFDAGFEVLANADNRGDAASRHITSATGSNHIHGFSAKPLATQSSQSVNTAGNRPENQLDSDHEYLTEISREITLQDFLRQQAATTPMSEKQHFLMELLIDSVNDRGYLRATLNDITELATPEYVVTEREVAQTISILQDFEPVGVGARNSRECLLLQLNDFSVDTPGLGLARQIVESYLMLLAKGEYKKIATELRRTKSDVMLAIELIRKLNPFPGTSITSTREQGVAPDLIVKKIGGQWNVRLNPNVMPAISIYQESEDLMRLAKGQAGYEKLVQTLQEARSLLNNIAKRFQTLLRVARLIIERQGEFLEQGEVALRPLTRKEIADALEMHISTVSRAVKDKYIHTPAGVLELNSFFSSALKCGEGEHISARAIQVQIARLISQERPQEPLSDNNITNLLNQGGIKVARRTVMKYREKLGIPASPKRRRLP